MSARASAASSGSGSSASSRACSSSFCSRASLLGETHDGREPRVLAPERSQLGGVPGDRGIGQGPVDFLRPLQRLAESGIHGLRLGGLLSSLWYFRRNRSTRPAVSTRRCLPVKYGWHCAQTSTWIDAAVERVSNEFPQAQTAVSLW